MYTQFPCDICDEDRPISIEIAKIYTNGQPIYTCGNCGFVYVRDRRSSADIAKIWTEELFQKMYSAKIPYVLARQTYVLDFIDSNIGIGNSKICDIGAGEGQFLQLCRARSSSASLFGLEPSPSNVSLMEKQGIECFEGTIEDFKQSFEQKKFDLITILWTLENCFSCNLMIKFASEMLEDQGRIIVATGSRILVPFKKPLGNYFSATPADTHCFRFSANSLSNVLRKNGFGNVKFNRYMDGDFLVAIAEKDSNSHFDLRKDDPKLIVEFFNRWHSETEWLHENNLISIS